MRFLNTIVRGCLLMAIAFSMRVDASQGAIAIGDLLVTSDVAGMAMKSSPVDVSGVSFHRPGTIIGKALEPLQSGTGEILVLLSLQ